MKEHSSQSYGNVSTQDADSVLHQLRKSTKNDAEESLWLVSYADMMTLLLIFFVLLVSISEVDSSRFEKVADGITEAIGKSNKKKVSLKDLDREINEFISQSGLNSELSSEVTPTGVSVSIAGAYLFESGSAKLSDKSVPLLERMSHFVHDVPYDVAVEGHTDDVPIRSTQFDSNWELSAARASGIVRLFIRQRVAPSRLRAIGFADTKPIAPARDVNTGKIIAENRAKNRRVVIQFLAY
ncbi:MAG: flagellar motor protein MotB [Calditrichia bacterium]